MMRRVPGGKDASGDDGEGEESVQGVETQGPLFPFIDGLSNADLSQERKQFNSE